MKTKSLFSVAMLACAAVLFYNCGGNGAAKMITKKWQIESMKSDAMDKQMATMKQQCDTTKDSAMKAGLMGNIKMMDGMMEAMKNTTMEYKADNTYEVTSSMMGQTQTEKGKWAVSADGKKLITTKDSKDAATPAKADTIDIGEVSEDKLVLNGKDQTGGVMAITLKSVK